LIVLPLSYRHRQTLFLGTQLFPYLSFSHPMIAYAGFKPSNTLS
jgi:hypothetical protein